ncbi:sensor histidine kinase [Streptomyces apricus]|uniref:sensor histidine kinase n=1 Tax=Streptomyces apricus TaxID=1828112 RepID=UPI001F390F46|nr:histidine kinase dimerization/phosphoacceptor domain-containing protein [Streptomyces apricus]
MLREDLRTLWTEPRPPDAPARVWRDWALLAAGLGGVVLEAALRENVVWRPVAVVFAVWVCLLLLWRRTRPLATVTLAFGSTMLLQVASFVTAPREPVGLDTGAVVLVLVYALSRWGSGREIVLGGAVTVAVGALCVVMDGTPVVEKVVGLVFLLLPGVVGTAVRFWVTARERQVEQVRSREREQLARELHDTVAHHVSAMVITAQAGRVLAGTDPSAAVQALEGVEEEGARTLEEMRAMVAALRDRGVGAELAPPAGVADLERLVRTPGGRIRADLGLDGELARCPRPWTRPSTGSCRSR